MLTKLAGCLRSWLNSWFCVTWDLTVLSLSPWNRKRLTKRGDVELLLRLVGENKHFFMQVEILYFYGLLSFFVGFPWDKCMNKVEEGWLKCLSRQADKRQHIIERSIVSQVFGFGTDYSHQISSPVPPYQYANQTSQSLLQFRLFTIDCSITIQSRWLFHQSLTSHNFVPLGRVVFNACNVYKLFRVVRVSQALKGNSAGGGCLGNNRGKQVKRVEQLSNETKEDGGSERKPPCRETAAAAATHTAAWSVSSTATSTGNICLHV